MGDRLDGRCTPIGMGATSDRRQSVYVVTYRHGTCDERHATCVNMMPIGMGLALSDRRRAWDDAPIGMGTGDDERQAMSVGWCTHRGAWGQRHATSVGCCNPSVHGVRRGATGESVVCCTYRCMGTCDERQATGVVCYPSVHGVRRGSDKRRAW